MAADIFVTRIAEHVEFSLVDAQDRAVRCYSVKGDNTVFKKVLKVAPAALKFLFKAGIVFRRI